MVPAYDRAAMDSWKQVPGTAVLSSLYTQL
jgi:hypothetical protein